MPGAAAAAAAANDAGPGSILLSFPYLGMWGLLGLLTREVQSQSDEMWYLPCSSANTLLKIGVFLLPPVVCTHDGMLSPRCLKGREGVERRARWKR